MNDVTEGMLETSTGLFLRVAPSSDPPQTFRTSRLITLHANGRRS